MSNLSLMPNKFKWIEHKHKLSNENCKFHPLSLFSMVITYWFNVPYHFQNKGYFVDHRKTRKRCDKYKQRNWQIDMNVSVPVQCHDLGSRN